MKRSLFSIVAIVAFAAFITGCTTEPQTESGKDKLHDNVQQELTRLKVTDPSLDTFLSNANSYVVFPTIGKGGFIVGGAYGHGEVYQHGIFVGYADISQATAGAQAGGQSFTEIIAFDSDAALDRFEKGQFAFAANASAVALKSGAAASAKYQDGVAVFTMPSAGLMFEAVVGGQSFSYQPK